MNHLGIFLVEWRKLRHFLDSKDPITIDGNTLSLAAVVAVSNHNVPTRLTDDQNVLDQIDESLLCLNHDVQKGRTIYGVNTGYGASSSLRTNQTEQLQSALLQLLNVGVLLPTDKQLVSPDKAQHHLGVQTLKSHALPEPIIRGMMLVRCNSLVRGHSGVRIDLVREVHKLLASDAMPVVPLRGSISASGDLLPLSYIAATLEGNPDIYVRVGSGQKRVPVPAPRALQLLSMEPLALKAKDGLAIANGTATSTAAASIAMFQAHQLAVWAQLMTAMTSEALLGSADNFAPFIAETRPHPGQREAAANIYKFLRDSKLTREHTNGAQGIVQDRYALRTAPQWIGPMLERLTLAHQQVQIELNSTTDNPLIDVEEHKIYNGGNFQAASITSAMELTSSSMQMLGKLVFAQSSELLNDTLNKNLPPNLSADDPSQSLPMKGLDISMAAYMAELAHLAHPISTHVQNAEMNNQAVNSMALVSARISLEAIEVLFMMAATHIYTLCQALDLSSSRAVWVTCRLEPCQCRLYGNVASLKSQMVIFSSHGHRAALLSRSSPINWRAA
ncbi:hypothetical protein FDECE_17994 [Fusarium decemcellulare]|nr:hypothetical protein FDECE_17994 [Fusarium decemcellulare]